MGEMLVMEVEIGEIKATHTGTTVLHARNLPLKHKQKQRQKKRMPLPFFFPDRT